MAHPVNIQTQQSADGGGGANHTQGAGRMPPDVIGLPPRDQPQFGLNLKTHKERRQDIGPSGTEPFARGDDRRQDRNARMSRHGQDVIVVI